MGTSIEELRRSVEEQHGGQATYVRSVPVTEPPRGKAVWVGVVQVFDLTGHPETTRAYAWSTSVEGSTKRNLFAVLHVGTITSPADAVRTAIAGV